MEYNDPFSHANVELLRAPDKILLVESSGNRNRFHSVVVTS